MKLGKGGQFEFPTSPAGYLTQVCGIFGTGIQHRQLLKFIFKIFPVKLSPHDIQVKTYILAHHKFCFRQGLIKSFQNLRQRHALLLGQFGRNPVNFFGIIRNVETFWLHQKILTFNKPSHFIVQLPGNLYTSWPVVGIG